MTTICRISDTKPSLISPREKEVLGLIAEEYTTKEIASRLYISYETANSHRKNLRIKLDARNAAGLIRKAFEKGLMQLSATIYPEQEFRRIS